MQTKHGRYRYKNGRQGAFKPDDPDIQHTRLGLAFWEWDGAEDRLVCSSEWGDLLGYGTELPAPDSAECWQHILEDDEAEFRKVCRDCLAGRASGVDMALRLRRVDDSVSWALAKGAALQNNRERPVKVAGYVVDVTRLRIDLRFLPRSGDHVETYKAMLDNAPDVLVRLDRNLFPLYVNAAISRYLPAAPQDLGASTYGDLGIDEDMRLFYQRNVARVFAEGRVIRERGTFRTPVQGELTGEYCFWPEFGPDGTVNAVMCRMQDITAQARIDQELRLNEERFAALHRLAQMQNEPEEEIIDFVVEQISLLTKSKHSYLFFPSHGDGGRGVIYWSKSMRELAGSTLPSDKMPHQCCNGNHDFDVEDELRRSYVVNMSQQEPGHQVFDLLQVRRYMIAPHIEEGRVACIASVCNKDADYVESDLRQMDLFIRGAWFLLQRKRYVRDLQKAKENAEEANQVKDEFLANVSHELRTPLNGMLSMLQLLELSPLSADQQEFVQTASQSGNALLRILSDILDYSRMESGKMDLRAEPFNLRETLLSSMSLFAGETRRRGLKVVVHFDDNLPATLLGDDARVRQIVFNLAGNAVKFTENGKVSLECSLLRHTLQNKAWVYFVVSDTGMGIPPQAHSHIFEAFTQLDSSSTRKHAGTGLGLGIVKHLVLLMGGSLAVESEPGEGTAIHCVLPFDRAAEPAAITTEQPQPAEETGRCLDILVAEDDPVGRYALQAFLLRGGHRVVCVENGRLALEALCLHSFDCLITDIQMPVMDGLETTQRIRQGLLDDITPGDETRKMVAGAVPEARREGAKTFRDLVVVALTAHAMAGDREHFLRMGMDLYLSKPIIMKELYDVLAQVAARTGPPAN